MYIKQLFFIFFIISQKYSNNKTKIFFPSNCFYIDSINKKKTVKHKRIIDILNANNLYYNLYKKSNKEKHIIEICQYIHKYYPYQEIHKKALIIGVYKLYLLESFEEMEKLQNILYDYYPNFNDLNICFGSFILLYEKLLHLNNNIQDNIGIILEIQNSVHYAYCFNKKPIDIINYTIHYFLCEFYLVHAIEAFNCNKYINSIVYLKKILIRANSHPKCALEALLLLIEIFCILNCKPLVDKYLKLLKDIYMLNLNNSFKENYYLRGLHIVNTYGFSINI